MQQRIKRNHDETYNKSDRRRSRRDKGCFRKVLSIMLCFTLLLQMLPTPLFIKQVRAEKPEQTTYEQYVALGQSILEDNNTEFADAALLSGQTISEDTVFQGDYVLSGGVLRIEEGAALTIDGNFSMKKGSLVVKGALQVVGDVWLSGGYITLSDTIHIEGNCYNASDLGSIENPPLGQTAILTMNHEKAQFIVDNNLFWQGEELLEESKGEFVISGDCALAGTQTDYSNVALKLTGEAEQSVAVVVVKDTEETGVTCEQYVTVKSLTTTKRDKEKEVDGKNDKEPVQIMMLAPVIVAQELALEIGRAHV